LKADQHGMKPITAFDTSKLTSHLACSFDANDTAFAIPSSATQWMDRAAWYTLHAVQEALATAGCHREDGAWALPPAHRIAVVMGSSHSGLSRAEELVASFLRGGLTKADRKRIAIQPVAHIGAVVCTTLGITGPRVTFSSACASSNTAIGYAMDLIHSDRAD